MYALSSVVCVKRFILTDILPKNKPGFPNSTERTHDNLIFIIFCNISEVCTFFHGHITFQLNPEIALFKKKKNCRDCIDIISTFV